MPKFLTLGVASVRESKDSQRSLRRKRRLLRNRRLFFEALEERRVLAVVTWDGEAGDDLWMSPANWSTNSVPAAADDVVIDVGSTTQIFLQGNAPAIGSIENHSTLFLEGRTDTGFSQLTIDGPSTNFGTIIMAATSNDGADRGSYLTTRNGATFTNAADGKIQVEVGDGGTLSGNIVNQGSITIVDGTRLSAAGSFTQAAGSIVAQGSGEFLQYTGSFAMTGGTTAGMVRVTSTTIDVAASATTPSVIRAVGATNVLHSQLSPQVTLWIEGTTQYGYSELFVDQDTSNFGIIRLETSSNDGADRGAYITTRNGATFTNASTGVIDARVGQGDGRIISGNFANNGHIVAETGAELFQGAGNFHFTGGDVQGRFRLQSVKIDVAATVTSPSVLSITGDGSILGSSESTSVTLWLEGNVFSGYSQIYVDQDVTNHGTILMESASNDNADRGSYLTTRNGATFTNAADGKIQVGVGDGGTLSGNIINQGSITIVDGTRLSAAGSFTQAAGSIVAQGSGEFLQYTGSFAMTGGTTAGMVRVTSTTIDVAASATTPSVIRAVGASNVLHSQLSPQVTLWIEGTTQYGYSQLFVDQDTSNFGIIRLETSSNDGADRGAYITTRNGAIFTNASTGTIDARVGQGDGRTISGNFTNNGHIVAETGAELFQDSGNFHFNGGDVQGRFRLQSVKIDVASTVTSPSVLSITGDGSILGSSESTSVTFWLEGNVFSGYSQIYVDQDVTNHGTILMEVSSNDGADRSSYLTTRGAAKFTNAISGKILVGVGDGGSLTGNIVNEGTVNVTDGQRIIMNGNLTQAAGIISTQGSGEFLQSGGSLIMTGGTTQGTVRFANTLVAVAATATISSVLRVVGNGNIFHSNLSSAVTLWLEGTTAYGYSQLFIDQDTSNFGTIRMESTSDDGGNQNSYLTSRNGAKLTNEFSGIIEARAGSGDDRLIFGNLINKGTIHSGNGELLNLVNVDFTQAAGSITTEGTGEVLLNQGQYYMTGGDITGNLKILGSLIDVAASVTQPTTLRIVGQGNSLGSSLSTSTTLWLDGNTAFGYSQMFVDQDNVNFGTIRLESSQDDGNNQASYLDMRNGARLTNAASGIIDLLPGAGDARYISGALVNNGTVRVRSGQTANAFTGTLINNGLIQVDSNAQFSLNNAAVTQLAGSISASSNSGLFQDGGSFTFNGGSLSGEVRVRHTTINVSSTVTTPSTLRVVGDSSVLGGNLSPNVTLWLEGNTLYSYSQLFVDQNASNFGKILMESTSDDGGNQASYIMTRNGAVLTNEASGVIEARAGAGDDRFIYGTLVNKGTITAGNGELLNLINVDFSQSAGSITTEGTGVVLLNQGHIQLSGGAVSSNFKIYSSTVDVAASVSQPTTLRLVSSNNTLGSALSPQVTLWLDGNINYGYSQLFVDQDETNFGKIRMESSSDDGGNEASYLSIRNGARLTNASSGTIELNAGAGDSRFISGNITNNGTIRVGSGMTSTSVSGSLENNATIQVDPNAQLYLSSTSFSQIGGTISTLDGSSVFNDAGSFSFVGGKIDGLVRVRNAAINVAPTVTSTSTLRVVGDGSVLNSLGSPSVTLWLEGSTVYGYSRVFIDQNTTNFGTIRMESTSDDGGNEASYINTRNGAKFTNATSGLIDVRAGAGDDRYFFGDFVNEGTLKSNTNLLFYSGEIRNKGIISTSNGALNFNSNLLINENFALISSRQPINLPGTTLQNFGTVDDSGAIISNLEIFPSLVQVGFSSALGMNPATVTSASYYNLVASGGDGIFGNANDIDLSSNISQVVFDSTSQLASLILSTTLANDLYLVTVNAPQLSTVDSVTLFTSPIPIAHGLGTATPAVELDLQSSSDTGFSSTDNLTNDNTPTFDVLVKTTGSVAFDFNNDGTTDQTVVVTVPGAFQVTSPSLVDGLNTVLAVLTPSVGVPVESKLEIKIDTLIPSHVNVFATETAPSTVRLIKFSEPLDGTNLAAMAVSITITGPENVNIPVSNVRLLNDTIEITYPAQTTPGVYQFSIASPLPDFAGNSPASPFEDSFTLRTTAQWIGGSGDWFDPTKWQGGRVPTADQDVVINVANGDPNVVITVSGLVEVKSLNVSNSITLAPGASLKLTSGSSQVAGRFVALHASLAVEGSEAQFVAVGLTSIDASSVAVSAGGRISLPALTTYTHVTSGNDQFRYFTATGAGSVLDLGNLQSITNGTHWDSNLVISATAGGVIDLHNVTTIRDGLSGDYGYRAIAINADGTGSLINLSSLTSFSDGFAYSEYYAGKFSSLQISNNANILLPLLQTLDGVSVDVPAGVLSLPSLTAALNSQFNVSGGTLNAPLLANILGTAVSYSGGLLTLDQVNNADRATLSVSGGKTLSLPRLLTYTHASSGNDQFRYFTASGAGSVLDLGNLQSITNGTHWDSNLVISATAGGVIDLRNVTTIRDGLSGDYGYRAIAINADGTGSLINLSSLTSFSDGFAYSEYYAGKFSSLQISNSANILLPSLQTLDGVSVDVAAGVLDLPSLTATLNSQINVSGGTLNAPLLTNILGTAVSYSGGLLTLDQVNNADRATLSVSGGKTLSLPKLLTYTHASSGNDQFRYFTASGVGSILDLGNLQSITNGTHWDSNLVISATAGGVIDLHNVTTIRDGLSGDYGYRAIAINADGTGSLINLNSLTSFSDGFAYSEYYGGKFSSLQISNNANVLLPSLQTLDGVSVDIPAGVLDLPSLTAALNSQFNVSGGTLNAPLLTNILGTAVSYSGGLLTLDQVNNADRATLSVSGGKTLSLPRLLTYTHASSGNDQFRYFTASGAGSVLDLGNLQSITNGTHWDSNLVISATAGGVIDLHNVTTIRDGQSGDYGYRAIAINADGTGSLINLSSLTSFSDGFAYSEYYAGKFSSLQISNNASVLLPSLQTLDGVSVDVLAGVLSLPSLTAALNSQINVSGGTLNAPLLTNILGTAVSYSGGLLTLDQVDNADRATLSVSGGKTLSLPRLLSYTHASSGNDQFRYFTASGAGSVLDLGNLQSITNGTHWDSNLVISATAGGVIDLHNVATIRDGQSGDYGYRAIAVSADGTGSLINLNSLTSFSDGFAYSEYYAGKFSSLQIFNNANVLLPSLQTLDGVSVDIPAGVLDLPSLTAALNSQFNVSGGTLNAPLLTNILGTAVSYSGGLLTLDQVNNADRATLSVSGGKTLSLPRLLTYTHASSGNDQFRYFTASGEGSVLDLGNLQSITNGTHFDSNLVISATAGGVVDLHNVATIRDGQSGDYNYRAIAINVDGTASLINLSSLTSFADDYANADSYGGKSSSITTANLGSLQLGPVTAIRGVSFLVNSAMTTASNLHLLSTSLLTGSGTLIGNVINTDASVQPGNGLGRLTITGNYTQESTSKMIVELSGNDAGTTYDQLVVQGHVILDGSLIINRSSNFSPSLGSAFSIITAGNGREGQFSSLSGIALPGNRELSTNYLNTGVTLVTDPSVGPYVSGLAPASPLASPASSIDVLFSKPIDPNTFTRGDVTLTGPDGLVIVDSLERLSDSAYRIHFQPQFVGTFTLKVGPGIADFVGNLMDQNRNGTSGEADDAFTGQFQLIPDTIAPTVVSVSPRGLRNAPFSSFQADFSEPIDVTSFTPSDVTIVGPSGVIASGSIAITPVSSLNRSFTVSFPEQSANFSYTITLNRDIRDRSGNQLPANYVFSVVVDTIGPHVQSVSTTGTINVPINAIDVTFDERIGNFTAANITIVGPDGTITTGNPLLIGNQQYRIPFATQRANGLYTLTVGPGVTDLAGNNMNAGGGTAFTSNFTVSLSDLTIAAGEIQLSNATTLFGNTINANWTTRNLGTLKSPSEWSDRIWLSTDATLDASDTLLVTSATNLTNGIDPAGASAFSRSITLPLEAGLAAGNYFILVQLDSNGNVEESNESNNVQATPIAISYPALPDLVAPPASMVGPNSIAPGSRFNFTWAIDNTGNADAVGPWVERIYVSSTASGADRQLLGDFTYTGTLTPADAPLARNQFFDMPDYGLAGALYFIVEVDSNSAIFESNEQNLFASTMQTNVPFALSWDLSSSSVNEGGGAIEAIVTRNGSVAAPLTVTITVNPTGQLAIPTQVVIPAGQYATRFNISAIDDSLVEGDQTVQLTLGATGFTGLTVPLNIIDNDRATLSFAIAPSNLLEGGLATATVTRNVATASDLVVTLDANRSQFNLPTTITIPANQTFVTFNLTAIDDTLIEATASYTFTASATGLISGSSSVTVAESDVPTLTIVLPATSLPEGASGPTVRGTVTRSVVTDRDVVVALVSSDPTQITLPATVTIPAGKSEAKFDITVIEDGLVNGSRSVILTARVQTTDGAQTLTNGAATQPITILDNDGPTLTLTSDRSIVAEDGTARLTISRNTDTTNALVVQLVSSDTTELQVPTTVTIPAGATSVQVLVSGINDSIADGDQNVTVTASASGFSSGVNALIVSDLDLPDLIVESIQTPVTAETGQTVNISWVMANVGYASASNAWTQRVYLSNTAQIGNLTLANQFDFTGPLPVGGYYNRTTPITMPIVPGQYWVVVEVDAANAVSEGFENNNLRISTLPITVSASYTVTVSTDIEIAPAGTTIPLHGVATNAQSNTPAAFKPVSIQISVQGTVRTISAVTDANGVFTATFKPLPGEGGTYTVGAAQPGVPNAPIQDSFRLLRLRSAVAPLAIEIAEGGQTTTSVAIQNTNDVSLSGLQVQLQDVPANLQATASIRGGSSSVLANQSFTIDLTVVAANANVLSGTISLVVTSQEGARVVIPVDFRVIVNSAKLVFEPVQITSNLARGDSIFFNMTIKNIGSKDSGKVDFQIPSGLDWISVASRRSLDNIAAGASATVALHFLPPSNLPLNTIHGSFVLSGDTFYETLPFSFNIQSTNLGSIQLIAEDEFTFFSEGKPPLSNATITLTNKLTGIVVASGVTDSAGIINFSSIQEGYYDITASATEHRQVVDTIFISPGPNGNHFIFVPRNLVSVAWKVEPTEVVDRTKITVETDFETNVPAPVIVVSPAFVDFRDLDFSSGWAQVEFTLTNEGLISAQDVALDIPENAYYNIIPLVRTLGTLTAKSSVTIPVRIELKAGVDPTNISLCEETWNVVYNYICRDKVWRAFPIGIVYGGDCRPVIENRPIGGSSGRGGGGGEWFVDPIQFEDAGCQICATVRLQIDQEAVQTRDAFAASLEITNNSSAVIDQVDVQIVVHDLDGHDVSNLFEVALTSAQGFGANQSVASGSVGTIQWIITPSTDAARFFAARYIVGGFVNYRDQGSTLRIPLVGTSIDVYPQAELNLDYFMQRDVLGDDPFIQAVEPSVPFSLAVQVSNTGAGDARNLRIESAQPKITENEKGLLIDFEIIGTSVNGLPVQRTMTASLGNIAAGGIAFAEWQLLSSLQGLFVDYSAKFQHVSGLGDNRFSLIKSVNIHELIHSVDGKQAGPVDQLPDFLVNDLPDPADLPDTLYLSNGTKAVVQLGSNSTFDAPPRLDDLRVGMTATMPAGWSYLKMDDPSAGAFELIGVQRSDGTMLPLKNFWQTDRTFIGGGRRPILENKIHLLDFNSTGQYTFIFSNGDVIGPSVLDVSGVPTAVLAPVDSVNVKFSELLDLATFDRADVTLLKNGIPVTLNASVQIVQVGGVNYQITGLSGFTSDDAVYELTVTATGLTDQVGNAGLGAKTLTWVKGQAAPAVVDVLGVPSGLSNVSPSVIDVQFTEPIVLTSFTSQDVLLTRGGTSLDLSGATFAQINDTTYRIGNIAALLAADGDYRFVVNATGVQDVDSGNSGIGSRTVTWTLDRTAPRVLDVIDITTDPRNIVVQRIDVEFSEPIDLASLDVSDLVLTRTGSTTNLLVNENRLSFVHLIGNVYRISGINWVQGFIANPQIAEFNFTISGSGIRDAAGNTGEGSASESWVIDLDRPLAATNLVLSTALGPVVGGQVPSMAATIAGNVSEVGLTVAIRDMTTDRELARQTLAGTQFQLPIVFPTAGGHQLRIRVVDPAGNTTDTFLSDLFVFDTPPVVESLTGLPELFTHQPIDAFVVKFVTPVNPSSVQRTSFRLSRNGGANLIDSSVVVTPQADGRSFRVSGLFGLTATDGRYDLTVDLTTILSTTGIVGSGNFSRDWKMDSVAPISSLAPLAATQPLITFAISPSGVDPAVSPTVLGSGVSVYEVYVSIDNGPFSLWRTLPADRATADFTGVTNRSYAFRSIAVDAAGNREIKSSIDATTFVPDLIAPTTTVDSVDTTHSPMTIAFSGTDVGSSLRFFDVFVSIDGAAPQAIARVQAGTANASGVYFGTVEYQAIADGIEHRYRIFTSGIDAANNVEETPGEAKGMTVTLTLPAVNHAPIANNDSFGASAPLVLEDGSLSANVQANDTDPDGDVLTSVLLSSPAKGSISLLANGNFTYTPFANVYGADSFTYQLLDGRGGVATGNVAITITPVSDAPSGADKTINLIREPNGAPLGMIFAASDFGFADVLDLPNANSLAAVKFTSLPAAGTLMLNGVAITSLNTIVTAFDIASNKLTFAPATNGFGNNYAGLDFKVIDDGSTTNGGVIESSTPNHITINVAAGATTLTTETFSQSLSRVSVRFSKALDVAKLNLVDSNGVNGASDLTLVGSTVGAVKGSMVIDSDGKGFTFVKSGGPFLADIYTLTLRSAANGFVDSVGNLLDGNVDGTVGDDYVLAFIVAAIPASTVILSAPDFERGAGQAVNLPANTTNGLPITISTGVNVKSASFNLNYNPDLLTISGGTTTIAGATVNVDTTTAGVARVTVTSAAQFSSAAGLLTLVNLIATIPTTAPIGQKSVLRLSDVSLTAVDASALTSATDDGLLLSAYKGDVNKSNSITTGDVTGLLRSLSGALSTTGFPSFKLTDPTIVGDMNDSSSLTTGDATGLLRFISGAAGGFPAIPALPSGLTPTTGDDPQIFVPQNLTVAPGGSVIVPINVKVTEATGVSIAGVDVSFTYDANRFTIGAITTGAALAGYSFSSSNNTATAGFARLVFAANVGPAFAYGFVGTLLNVTLTAKPGVASGASSINLTSAGASDNNTNDLTIAPAITSGVDSSDGVITILGSAKDAPTAFTVAAGAGFDFEGTKTWSLAASVSDGSLSATTISSAVTVSAGAFSIVDNSLLAAHSPVALAQSPILVIANTVNTVFTLPLGSGLGVETRSGEDSTGRGNALADSNFVPSIDLKKVTDGTSKRSPTNSVGSGDNQFCDQATDAFFRMLGESNADERGSITDTEVPRSALSKSDTFDFNDDRDGQVFNLGFYRANSLGKFGKRRR